MQYGEKPVTSTALIAAALAAGIDTGTSKDSKDRAQKLGYFLRDKRNRIVGGYRITSRSANNTTQWRLEKVA